MIMIFQITKKHKLQGTSMNLSRPSLVNMLVVECFQIRMDQFFSCATPSLHSKRADFFLT